MILYKISSKSSKAVLLASSLLFCFSAAADLVSAVDAKYGNGTWWKAASAWSPAGVPDLEHDYVLDRNNTDSKNAAIRFGSDTDSSYNTFSGRSLQVGIVGGKEILFLGGAADNMSLDFGNVGDGLVLANGSLMSFWYNVTIGGNVTVKSPASAPFEIRAGASSKPTTTLTGALRGGDTCGLVVSRLNNGGTKTNNLVFPLTFNASAFYGRMTYPIPGVNSKIGDITFNGHFVANGANLSLASKTTRATFSKMTLSGETALALPNDGTLGGSRACGHIAVTNDFAVDGVVTVSLSPGCNGWQQGAEGHTEFPFLTVPNASAVSESDLVCNYTPISGVFYPVFEVRSVNNGNGTKTFKCVRRAYVQVQNTTFQYDNVSSPTKFTWNGSEYIEDCDYFTAMSESREIPTPVKDTISFGGKSAAMVSYQGQRPQLKIQTRDITFDDLRIQASNGVYAVAYSGSSEATLRGGLMLFNGPAYAGSKVSFAVGGSAISINVASAITGDADAKIDVVSSEASRMLTFSGDNSQWKGGMEVSAPEGRTANFRITRAEALGGELDAFRANALELGANAILSATNTVMLSEPTRGVTVSGNATIDVAEGETLGLVSDVAFASGVTLTKTGAGTLALGGKAVAASGAALVVQQGFVKPLATDALDGVTISCAAKAGLMVDAESGDAGMASRGVVNPMLADGATLRVKVGFDSEPQCGTGSLYVPICTVAAADADALGGRISLLRPWPKYGAFLERRVNGDGTVTFVARVEHVGICLIVF